MPKLAEAEVTSPTPEAPDVVIEPGTPLTPEEVATAESELRVDYALRPPVFVNYLLSRKPKQRIGQRKGFATNAIATYAGHQLGGEWLCTATNLLDGEDMRSYELPGWLARTLETISSAKDAPPYITRQEALEAAIDALALAVDGSLYTDETPF